ncbi:MAG TPA: hypothetical protein DDZ20_06950 [Hyphomonas sp.]|nr:MAG: hypothetical protein GOVbin52_24 [Prokaryotic dsDNA virus sp.]HBJ40490.1 hypothetical protein [Hyphomonas sp.]HBX93869.1 hypothetical protein [Hyphomonas sp.]|tara:strand:+ start:42136 stop:42465 length:330 start_codon:yes stop_codon:yes gene_type:complete
MVWLASIGQALKTSALVRWIAGGLAAGATFLTWLALHDAKIRKIERLKDEKRAADQRARAKDYIDTMEEELEDEAHDAIEARDRAGPLDPDSMSDEQHARIFGRDGTSS